ncbi:TPA: hypothetical protein DEP58_03715 [Patescibacteria group bacterium]|nr:hypothetical protein [Patescibacteria group bacterium]
MIKKVRFDSTTHQRMGAIKKKVLLLLYAGIGLGLTRRPDKQWQIIRTLSKEWKEIHRATLHRAVESLYQSHLVEKKKNKDGTTTMILTHEGRRTTLHYKLENITLSKKKKWDGKWYVVMYDIPEKKRALREILFNRLKTMGFVELQHSVFVYPHDCRRELEFVIEAYEARKYIRCMEVTYIDDESVLRKKFKIHKVQ